MAYYVYIIQSQIDGTYYKGFTEDYANRLDEHNNGLSAYTSTKRPWNLIYVEVHETKKAALIREKKLKKCKADYFIWLSNQNSNILKK